MKSISSWQKASLVLKPQNESASDCFKPNNFTELHHGTWHDAETPALITKLEETRDKMKRNKPNPNS
jgi:hypothetical protein